MTFYSRKNELVSKMEIDSLFETDSSIVCFCASVSLRLTEEAIWIFRNSFLIGYNLACPIFPI